MKATKYKIKPYLKSVIKNVEKDLKEGRLGKSLTLEEAIGVLNKNHKKK